MTVPTGTGKSVFIDKMALEVRTLCSELDLDPECIGAKNNCGVNRAKLRALRKLIYHYESDSDLKNCNELVIATLKTIVNSETRDDVQDGLKAILENGEKILRSGQPA